MQLDVRRWDLQGAVAGDAAAELETWSLLPAVCRRGGNSCLSWATVAVKHKLSLCSWGTLGVFPVEKNLSPDSYPRFIPDSYPDSYPSAAICSQGSTSEAMPPKSSEDTKLKEKHCRNQLAAFFCRSSPEGGFGRLTAMYQARGTPPVRRPLASARLPFEDVSLVRDWCRWRACLGSGASP